MIHQQLAGIRLAPEDLAPKPDELKKYEQMKETGLSLVAGGLQDQPHIWLLMLKVIKDTIVLFEAQKPQPLPTGAEGSNAN